MHTDTHTKKTNLLAGVDEVGRGPLAGPVVAAAVILDPSQPISGLTDSKLLSANRRQTLAKDIKLKAIAWAVAAATRYEIDRINILQASLLAMQRAILALAPIQPDHIVVDGKHCPQLPLPIPMKAIVQGDKTVAAISAASIIAKVARDDFMQMIAQYYPAYDFAKHKGYPTKQHLTALAAHGISDLHRRSYKPVEAICARTKSTKLLVSTQVVDFSMSV